MSPKPLSYLEINREQLQCNVRAFRALLGDSIHIAAVVKANAYGHGLQEVVTAVQHLVDYFQIDSIEELRVIRGITQKPVLLFGYVQKSDLLEVVELGCEITVYDIPRLQILNQIGERLQKKIPVHLKIDAHLGRLGVLLSEFNDFCKEVSQLYFIDIVGAYAHFANIEDTADQSHATKQLEAYHECLKILELQGFSTIKTHISATSGILVYEKKQTQHSLVRLGLGLYGMWPSKELIDPSMSIAPALRWVTHIAQVKTIPLGYSVGYGLTFIAPQEMTIAIVPQGYADGFDRGFSNNGHVLIRGKRCSVLGRVAMNMMVVDVGHLEAVEQEDEVVLVGTQGSERLTAEELAERIGTINYEVTTRISSLLPRTLI